jgi:MoxR-like ATPase
VHDDDGAVVLLDEIDKADPDLPDDLLGPLDTMTFAKPAIAGSGDVAVPEGRQVLIVLTDNRERDLSAAFRRRCVELSLEPASDALLRRVAAARFGARAEVASLAEVVIGAMGQIAAARDEEPDDGRPAPSTAEFVNTVEACIELGIPADKANGYFQEILSVALAKGRGYGPDAVPAED